MEEKEIRYIVSKELMFTEWWESHPTLIKELENSLVEALTRALSQSCVSGMLKCCSCGYEYEELIVVKDGNMKCKDCAF